MVEISVSVLNVKKENAIQTFYNLETSKIDFFHIDVMDGKFVKKNNKKLMSDYALSISHISNIGLDVHLMVENIEEFIDEYLDLNPEYITFHIEACKSKEQVFRLINKIKDGGVKVGLAISPDTKIEDIVEFLPYIHMCLIMTVVPGEGGQEIILECINKVKSLKEYVNLNNIDIDIEVDGGINKETSKMALKAGANVLVSGSYIISSENYKEAVESLK